MPPFIVGLPSSPRPPNKNRPTISANQSSLHALTAAPSATRYDTQRHLSTGSMIIPSESQRPSRAALHRAAASETLRMSPHWGYGGDRPLSTNSPYVEHGKTNQPKASVSETAGIYWNRVGEVTSALAQWKASIPALGDIMNEFVEDDNHLLRVMRAYHLNKAQTREELPDWLFDEKERGKFALLPSHYPTAEKVSGTTRHPPRGDQRDQVVPPKPSLVSSPNQSQRWTRLLSKRRKPGATRNLESLRLV